MINVTILKSSIMSSKSAEAAFSGSGPNMTFPGEKTVWTLVTARAAVVMVATLKLHFDSIWRVQVTVFSFRRFKME